MNCQIIMLSDPGKNVSGAYFRCKNSRICYSIHIYTIIENRFQRGQNMLADLTLEEISAGLDAVVEEILAQCRWEKPPVDAFSIAQRTGNNRGSGRLPVGPGKVRATAAIEAIRGPRLRSYYGPIRAWNAGNGPLPMKSANTRHFARSIAWAPIRTNRLPAPGSKSPINWQADCSFLLFGSARMPPH